MRLGKLPKNGITEMHQWYYGLLFERDVMRFRGYVLRLYLFNFFKRPPEAEMGQRGQHYKGFIKGISFALPEFRGGWIRLLND